LFELNCILSFDDLNGKPERYRALPRKSEIHRFCFLQGVIKINYKFEEPSISSILKMRFFIGTVLILVLVTPARTLGGGFNKVLQFPREVSLSNFVLLRPDFTQIQEELSICSWVKIYRTDHVRYWFSYNIGKQIILFYFKYLD